MKVSEWAEKSNISKIYAYRVCKNIEGFCILPSGEYFLPDDAPLYNKRVPKKKKRKRSNLQVLTSKRYTILNKKEIAQKYFSLMHDKGKVFMPPYTYSFILADEDIYAVQRGDRIGFMMPPYEHFILPSYFEKDGDYVFDNTECLYAFPASFRLSEGRMINTQFILHRDYTLMKYRKFDNDLNGKGEPILFNKKEFEWYLNNRRVNKDEECLYKVDAGQHFFKYQVDDVKVIIVWDDYYSSAINILSITHAVYTSLQHAKFEHPYTVWAVYINALVSFMKMFPSGTLFNTTLAYLRGLFSIIYVGLHPIQCFDICTMVKGDIKENIRKHMGEFTTYSKKKLYTVTQNVIIKDKLHTPKVKHTKYKRKKKKTNKQK
jgi:hypothetical protein